MIHDINEAVAHTHTHLQNGHLLEGCVERRPRMYAKIYIQTTYACVRYVHVPFEGLCREKATHVCKTIHTYNICMCKYVHVPFEGLC
jgi:hypothetical protein